MLQDELGNGVIMKSGAIMIFVADSGDAKTVVQMTTKELSLVQKDTGLVKLTGGNVTILASASAGPRRRQREHRRPGHRRVASPLRPVPARRSVQERVHQPLRSPP